MPLSTTKADVICPRWTRTPAGTDSARRGRAVKCARPNVPEWRTRAVGQRNLDEKGAGIGVDRAADSAACH